MKQVLPMNPLPQSLYGPIRQLAYVVGDIDSAIASWHRQMSAGPFAVCRGVKPLEGSKYRGEDSHGVELNLAFAYIGDVQLELIQPLNNTPSLYKEAIERGIHSLHHYGFCVEDFAASYQHAMDNGFTAVVDAGVPGVVQMSYVESTEIPGLILELIEWNDLTRPYFDGVQNFLANADSGKLVHDYQL